MACAGCARSDSLCADCKATTPPAVIGSSGKAGARDLGDSGLSLRVADRSDPVSRARARVVSQARASRARGASTPACPGKHVKDSELARVSGPFCDAYFQQYRNQPFPDTGLKVAHIGKVQALDGGGLTVRDDDDITCDCRLGIQARNATNSGISFDVDGIARYVSLQFGGFAHPGHVVHLSGYYRGSRVVGPKPFSIPARAPGRVCQLAWLDAREDRFDCIDRFVLGYTPDVHPRIVALANHYLRRPAFHVALTFDYGPNPVPGRSWTDPTNTTRQTAVILAKNDQIKGTFFLERVNLETQGGRDMVAELHRSGHEIAISTVDPRQLHCMYGAAMKLDPGCGASTRDCLDRYLREMLAILAAIDPSIRPRFVRAAVSENSQCKFLADRNPGDWPEGIGLEERCKAITTPDEGFLWSDLIDVIRNNGLQFYLRGGTRVIPRYRQRKEHGPTGWAVQLDTKHAYGQAQDYVRDLVRRRSGDRSTVCLVALGHDFKPFPELHKDSRYGGYLPDVAQLLGTSETPGYLQQFVTWLHDTVGADYDLQFVPLSELANRCHDQLPDGYRTEAELAAIKCPTPWG